LPQLLIENLAKDSQWLGAREQLAVDQKAWRAADSDGQPFRKIRINIRALLAFRHALRQLSRINLDALGIALEGEQRRICAGVPLVVNLAGINIVRFQTWKRRQLELPAGWAAMVRELNDRDWRSWIAQGRIALSTTITIPTSGIWCSFMRLLFKNPSSPRRQPSAMGYC